MTRSGPRLGVGAATQQAHRTVTPKLREEGEDHWLSLEASGGEGDTKKIAEEVTRKAAGWEFKINPGRPRRS